MFQAMLLRRPPWYAEACICSPFGVVAANDACCSRLFPRERRASSEARERLKRASKSCIGAPAGMQRRRSAFRFFTVCVGIENR